MKCNFCHSNDDLFLEKANQKFIVMYLRFKDGLKYQTRHLHSRCFEKIFFRLQKWDKKENMTFETLCHKCEKKSATEYDSVFFDIWLIGETYPSGRFLLCKCCFIDMGGCTVLKKFGIDVKRKKDDFYENVDDKPRKNVSPTLARRTRRDSYACGFHKKE